MKPGNIQINHRIWVDLNEELGKGSTGNVYLGHCSDPQPHRIAVKRIPLKEINNEVTSYLLQCELQSLKCISQIKNDSIVRLIDIVVVDEHCHIAMELLQGGTLKQYLGRQKKLEEKQALSIITHLLEGYKILKDHRIIHRDLKPDNIIFSQNSASAPQNPKIIDFGYCEMEKLAHAKPKMYYNVGSPRYMSPEAYTSNQYSEKSDIWALGVIFYEMLTGTNFDKGKTVVETFKLIKQKGIPIPSSLGGICRKFLQYMLMFDVRKRWGCDQLLAELKKQKQQGYQDYHKLYMPVNSNAQIINREKQPQNNSLGKAQIITGMIPPQQLRSTYTHHNNNEHHISPLQKTSFKKVQNFPTNMQSQTKRNKVNSNTNSHLAISRSKSLEVIEELNAFPKKRKISPPNLQNQILNDKMNMGKGVVLRHGVLNKEEVMEMRKENYYGQKQRNINIISANNNVNFNGRNMDQQKNYVMFQSAIPMLKTENNDHHVLHRVEGNVEKKMFNCSSDKNIQIRENRAQKANDKNNVLMVKQNLERYNFETEGQVHQRNSLPQQVHQHQQQIIQHQQHQPQQHQPQQSQPQHQQHQQPQQYHHQQQQQQPQQHHHQPQQSQPQHHQLQQQQQSYKPSQQIFQQISQPQTFQQSYQPQPQHHQKQQQSSPYSNSYPSQLLHQQKPEPHIQSNSKRQQIQQENKKQFQTQPKTLLNTPPRVERVMTIQPNHHQAQTQQLSSPSSFGKEQNSLFQSTKLFKQQNPKIQNLTLSSHFHSSPTQSQPFKNVIMSSNKKKSPQIHLRQIVLGRNF